MATATNTANQNDTTTLINDWKESWVREIDLIARAALQEADQILTEVDLNGRLQETLNESFEGDFASQATENGFQFGDDWQPYIGDWSRQQSESSAITSTVGQALVIRQHATNAIKCFKDPAGVMAINGDQLAYVDFVWNRENIREMKMHVIANATRNVQDQGNDRIINFPYIGEGVRVVDMDYWPKHDRYVLAIVQTGKEHSSCHYLFNPSADDDEQAFERWMNCEPGDTISRVSCTAETVYEIVNHYSRGFVLLLNVYGVTSVRKSASSLFPPDSSRYRSDTLRLIDICCSSSNKQLAVAYNCCSASHRGQVGIHIFDPTQDWTLLARIGLGYTAVQYYMPRLLYLNKVDLLVALNIKTGHLLFYNSRGEQMGKRSFIWYAREYEEGDPHMYPVNICATQNLVVVRFSRYITIHRIND